MAMHGLWAVVLLAAAPMGDHPEPAAAKERSLADAPAVQRRYHEISRDIQDAMRRDAFGKSVEERAPAIREMAALYTELRLDPRLESSDTLQQYKTKLWSRLTRVKRDLERQMQRQAKAAGSNTPSPLNVPGGGLSSAEVADGASETLAAQLALVSYSMGGPAQVLSASGGAFGGGMGPADFGPDLVDLIERTINPQFWDTVGGPGTIYYYAPLRVLVVRATSEVHENVGGLLGGLRAAGN
jgi:hypothetical protein